MTDMEQISIWDILPKEKSDFPCDTCKHDVQGCCDYAEPLGKHCVLGDAYEERIPEGWERIPDTAEIKALEEPKDFTDPQDNPYIIYPDKVAKGRVNRIPCIIGYLIGVSGYNECFETLVPKFFKRTTIGPCPLKDYCTNNPAGCEGRTWWCARTIDEV